MGVCHMFCHSSCPPLQYDTSPDESLSSILCMCFYLLRETLPKFNGETIEADIQLRIGMVHFLAIGGVQRFL